jgi:hypothetical protein
MPGPISTYGVIISVGDTDGSSPVYTAIPETSDPALGGVTLDVIETTVNPTTAGTTPWKRKTPTLLEAGEFTFKINFDPSQATHGLTTGLLAIMLSRSPRKWKIDVPSTPLFSITFVGYVTNFPMDMPLDGVWTVPVTVTVQQGITFSQAGA